MIEVKGLTKVYQDKKGQVTAARDISFVARPGRVFGLLGRNGAGKTTTLRMLATILMPNEGTATIQGHDLVTQPELVRRSIGFHTSDTKLYDRLTGRESLRFYGELQGLSSDQAKGRVAELAREFLLDEFLDRRVAKLSAGQKQRISLARVVVHRPPVLILDEPTVGLDIWAAREVVNFIRRMKDEGRTVVLSTHIMSEVDRLCDELAIIEKGAVVESGAIQEIKDRHNCKDLEDVFFKLVREEVSA